MPTTGRVSLVTGAASGIGLALAHRLAQPDSVLLLLDRSPRVHDIAQALRDAGNEAESVVCELGDEGALIAALRKIEDDYGRCDVLVNNAGIHSRAPDGTTIPVADTPSELWHEIIAVNLTAPFLLSRWALRLMRERRWGRIVNVASMAARIHVAGVGAHYAASKAGLIGFTRVLAGEGGRYGVTANCVAPGKTRTPLYAAGSRPREDEELRAIPLGRAGEPDEIAAVVAFLVSAEASYVTGSVIDVNGGIVG